MAERLQKLRYGQDITSELFNKIIDTVNQLADEHKVAELNKDTALEKIAEFESKFTELADQYSNTLSRVPDFADMVKTYFSSYSNTFSVTDEINENSPFAIVKNLAIYITDDIASFILNHTNIEKAIVFEFKETVVDGQTVKENNMYIKYGANWNRISGGEGGGSITLPENLISISSDYTWVINGVDTQLPAYIQGPQGKQGIQGIQGEKGEKGDTGIQGPKGATGNPGKTLACSVIFSNSQNLSNPSDIYNDHKYMGIKFYYADDPDSVNESVSYKVIRITGDTWYPYFDGTYLKFTKNLNEATNFGQAVNIKGDKGDQGEKGDTGEQGPRGPKGEDGRSINVRASAEQCTIVGEGYIDSNGDLQILTEITADAENNKVFTNAGKVRGPQGEKGDTGPQGPGGYTPYIDSETGNWFVNGVNTGVHAKGETGIAQKIEYTAQTKNNLIGQISSEYVKDDKIITSDGYLLTYDETLGWVETLSIKGKDGSTILSGSTAPESSQGNNGDLYLNTGTYDLYKKTSGSWAVLFNMRGQAGSTPAINSSGYWTINGISTGVRARPTNEVLLSIADNEIDTYTYPDGKANAIINGNGDARERLANDTNYYDLAYIVNGSNIETDEIQIVTTGGAMELRTFKLHTFKLKSLDNGRLFKFYCGDNESSLNACLIEHRYSSQSGYSRFRIFTPSSANGRIVKITYVHKG